MTERIFFDVTGLIQWYAYMRNPSGIQRVMENVLADPLLAGHGAVEFIARPLGSDRFFKVDAAYIRGLRDPQRRRWCIASLRRIFADSMRRSDAGHLWKEMLRDHLPYMVIGRGGAARYWQALHLGFLPPKSAPLEDATPPTERDVLVILGDFWCHKGQVESLIRLKNAAGVRIMTMIHDLFPVYNFSWCHPYYGREFVKQFTRLVDHVDHWLTNSHYVRRQLLQFHFAAGKRARTVDVLPMGWPTTEPRWIRMPRDSAVLQRHGLESDGYFLCVGTLEPRKNLGAVIDAAQWLWERYPERRRPCIFVGRAGWKSEALTQRLRALEKSTGCVRWLNDVEEADLPALYRGARFTIVSSHNEGWGLVVQESLAHGVPCIASAVGGMVESGSGLADYVDPDHPTQLLETIDRYAGDDARLNEARWRIEKRLREGPRLPDWSTTARHLLALTGLPDSSSRDAAERRPMAAPIVRLATARAATHRAPRRR